MKSNSLTVLWPRLSAPDIEEIRFSYEFCHKISRQFCEAADMDISWNLYAGDPHLKEILPRVEGDALLHVSHPEIVLSPSALRQLMAGIHKGYGACGPVYNECPRAQQVAQMPATYVDMDTFLEVANIIEQRQDSECIAADALYPACILYGSDFLAALDPDIRLSRIVHQHTASTAMAVAKAALVHLGFNQGLETERSDLVRLIPAGVRHILDLGCARGGYGRLLKRLRPEIRVTGVELNPEMAREARPHYHQVHTRAVEDARFKEKFDLVNCGDIMEHLRDPWAMLNQINGLLKKDGYLVLSLPNAGHWSIVRALLKGEFQYIPLGLLCIGHLRWFTESSIRISLKEAGFSIDILERQQVPPTPLGERFVQDMGMLGYGEEESLRTNEFLIRAGKL